MNTVNFTAIDFETANWYRKSACSIGLVRIEAGQIVDTFYSLIKPEPNFFHPINTRIHGITADMCTTAPTFSQLWHQIAPLIDGQILVAHNASFEKSVLNHLFIEHNIENKIVDFLCTLYLSKVHFNKLDGFKLPLVYKHLTGKDVDHHNALEDAMACAEIALHVVGEWKPPHFERMVSALYETSPKSRTGKEKTPLTMLQPDYGWEGNQQCKGMNVTFTGELEDFTREEAAQFIVNRGGKAGESVTKATTHLVIGGYALYGDDHKSGKFKRAVELMKKGQDIRIMSGIEFLELTKSFDAKPSETLTI